MTGFAHIKSQIPLLTATGSGLSEDNAQVLVANAPGAWGELVMEEHRSPATELMDLRYKQHVLVVNVGAPLVCEYKKSGRWQLARKGLGAISFFPSGTPFSRRMRTTADAIYLALNPSLFDRDEDDRMPATVDFSEIRKEGDPFLQSFAQTLQQAARTDLRKDLLFGSSMAMSLARHLLYHYSPAKLLPKSGSSALLDDRSLAKVREFIEANLDNGIKVQDIAEVAGLSASHFSRIFRKTTGRSPYRYVADLRLRRAKEMLLSGRSSVKEVTYSLGFSDQSHLTREVKREYGLTPKEMVLQALQ